MMNWLWITTFFQSPRPKPYTLHPTLYTQHPTPYTLDPTPYTLHPTPYAQARLGTPDASGSPAAPGTGAIGSTLNPQPSTLNPQPSTLSPQPSTLN